jgi:two-component system cell cycle response regulator
VFCDRSADDPAFTESDQLHLQVVGYLIGNMMEKFDLVQESKRLSQVDDATGVLQYKAFVPALATEFERAKKHGYDVVLSLLAVEAFRKYVETYGIDQAHALLEEVAGVIKECITDMDVLARFGADQFVLCLSGLTRDEASERLSRIRNTIQERVVGQGDFAIDAAVGALVLQGEADMRRSLQDILSALGKSLVKAKSQKGSTVSIETMPAPA